MRPSDVLRAARAKIEVMIYPAITSIDAVASNKDAIRFLRKAGILQFKHPEVLDMFDRAIALAEAEET